MTSTDSEPTATAPRSRWGPTMALVVLAFAIIVLVGVPLWLALG